MEQSEREREKRRRALTGEGSQRTRPWRPQRHTPGERRRQPGQAAAEKQHQHHHGEARGGDTALEAPGRSPRLLQRTTAMNAEEPGALEGRGRANGDASVRSTRTTVSAVERRFRST
jgi:hypothetical protein